VLGYGKYSKRETYYIMGNRLRLERTDIAKKGSYKKRNKLLVYLSIVLFFLLNLLFLFYFRTFYFAVNLSFLLNFMVITVGISLNALKKKLELFDTAFWSFSYIFFFIAPVIQTYNGDILFNFKRGIH